MNRTSEPKTTTTENHDPSPSEIALFFGAGVSISPPTSLPCGCSVLDAIWKGLCTGVGEAKSLESRPAWPQFEIVLNCLRPYPRVLKRVLQVFDRISPNRNHHLIARLGKAGCWLVTTNFDENVGPKLDARIRFRFGTRKFQCFHRSPGDPGPVLKLHGTIPPKQKGNHGRKGRNGTVIATISDLLSRGRIRSPSLLSKNRRDELEFFLENRICFFLGYSGGDKLDILPALRLLPERRLIRIQHKAGCTISSEKLHELFSVSCQTGFAEDGEWYNHCEDCDTTQFLETLCRRYGVDTNVPETEPTEGPDSLATITSACESLRERAGTVVWQILREAADSRAHQPEVLALLRPDEVPLESQRQDEIRARNYMDELARGQTHVWVLAGGSPRLEVRNKAQRKKANPREFSLRYLTPTTRAKLCYAIGNSLLKDIEAKRRQEKDGACAKNMFRKAWCLWDFLQKKAEVEKAAAALKRLHSALHPETVPKRTAALFSDAVNY